MVPVHSLSFVAEERTVICGTTPVKLAPALFCRAVGGLPNGAGEDSNPVRAGENAQAEEFLKIYRRVVSTGSAEYEAACKTVKTPEYFLKYIQEKRTQVNKALRAKLGERDSRHYRIETIGRRPKRAMSS